MPIDLEKLVGLWPAVIEQVRESGSGLLSQMLSAGRPVAVNVEEAVLDVGFPASAAFNKRKAEAAEARDRLADAVKTIVGERLRPVYVLLDADADAAPDERKLRGRALRADADRVRCRGIRARAGQPDEAKAKEA